MFSGHVKSRYFELSNAKFAIVFNIEIMSKLNTIWAKLPFLHIQYVYSSPLYVHVISGGFKLVSSCFAARAPGNSSLSSLIRLKGNRITTHTKMSNQVRAESRKGNSRIIRVNGKPTR